MKAMIEKSKHSIFFQGVRHDWTRKPDLRNLSVESSGTFEKNDDFFLVKVLMDEMNAMTDIEMFLPTVMICGFFP